MTPFRKHLAAVFTLAALSVLFAYAWIANTDQAAAQGFRKQKAGGKNSEPASDEAVFKALNGVISVDFKGDDSTLKKALDFVDKKTGGALNILLDDTALKDAGVDPAEKPVLLRMNRFTVRSVLHALLEPNGLGYYIEDGSLRIADKKKACDQLVVKLYPVGRFVADLKTLGALGREAALRDNATKQSAQSLAMLIMNSVEPKYWAMHLERLVVRQTPQVHQDIERFITELKAAVKK